MPSLWHIQEIVVSLDVSSPLQEAVPQPSPTIFDTIKWGTLPYVREKAVSSPFPLFNVAVVLSRTLTYVLTYNIDLGDEDRGKVALPN